MPHQLLRFGLSAAGKAKFAALPEKNPAHLFAVQVSYCAGSVLLTKMLHFKRAKSAFAALCNVEKRQAVWYNREHADNTRLDFRRASPQSKRMDFNIMNKNSFRYKNKRRTGRLRSFLSPALAALMVFSSLAACTLTACKKDVGTPEDNAASKDENTEEKDKDEQESWKIGFSGIDMENPYFLTLESAIKEELDGKNCELIVKDPKTDPDMQASQIQEMIDEGINAIILSPVDWEKITPSLEALKEADVKIVNVDTQVKEMDYVDAYIGSDNYNAGVLCGEDLIKRCPDGGKVAILECPTQNSVNERITGFEETLAKAENGFEIVAREDTSGEFQKSLEAAQKILSENSDIVAIMCGNDQMAVGAKTAMNVAEQGQILIYGVDGSPDIKKELKKTENQIAGTVAQSPISMGKDAANTVLNILNGKDYEKEIKENVFMINQENVDMYGVDGWQ